MDPARLRSIPVFSELEDDDIAHIAALAAEASVPGGKELVREGDYPYAELLVTMSGWDIRRLRKTAPDAVDHLRGVVAQRREHA